MCSDPKNRTGNNETAVFNDRFLFGVEMTHHVILGAGPAGVIAAETIRKLAPEDTITIVGDEPEPPYSRMAIPYLLMGNIGESGTYLRKSPTHFEDLKINVVRALVQSVQAATKTIALTSGETLGYDTLLIATGSHPVSPPIPGIQSEGVHTCWTLADARAIAERASPVHGCCNSVLASSAASSWKPWPHAV